MGPKQDSREKAASILADMEKGEGPGGEARDANVRALMAIGYSVLALSEQIARLEKEVKSLSWMIEDKT